MHPFTDEEISILAHCAVAGLQDGEILDMLDLSDEAAEALIRKINEWLNAR